MNESPSQFGINTHVPNERALALVCDHGIKWVRIDFNWEAIEPQRGRFEWGQLAAAVNKATQLGLSVFGTLAYTPGWANGRTGRNQAPADPNLWPEFVRRTVTEFKGKVRHWGIWNEPNLQKYWAGGLDLYANMILRPGAQAVKTIDATAVVVAPDLICTKGAKWWEWYSGLAKNGALALCDAVSCHVYMNEGPDRVFQLLEQGEIWAPAFLRKILPYTKSIREVLAECGVGSRPLWLTESGWFTGGGDDAATPQKQAEFYRDFVRGAAKRKSWLQRVFFYELMDDPNTKLWGVVDKSGQPKPALMAYRDAIKETESTIA